MLKTTAGAAAAWLANPLLAQGANAPMVQTVLGPVAPDLLGVTLMHEHAPVIDWSELYETPPAPLAPMREPILAESARLLDSFHATLAAGDGPGAIVETTPIRVGRYPRLLVELAKRTKVHIIASSGFWCEALAPQHPWAVRLGVTPGGIDEMAVLFIREVSEGMEDPSGAWGEKFTDIRAGIIKIGTSTFLRPSERAVHRAAAMASEKTGCPITTHTTDGGGLEQAEVLLKHGAAADKVIIGHQGHQDDRENDEAHDYHKAIAGLGCYVQFDRVSHGDYGIDKQARQVVSLVEAGFINQVLLSHDNVPYFLPNYTAEQKGPEDWQGFGPDFTTITTKLADALATLGVSQSEQRTILVDNPKRVLAF